MGSSQSIPAMIGGPSHLHLPCMHVAVRLLVTHFVVTNCERLCILIAANHRLTHVHHVAAIFGDRCGPCVWAGGTAPPLKLLSKEQ